MNSNGYELKIEVMRRISLIIQFCGNSDVRADDPGGVGDFSDAISPYFTELDKFPLAWHLDIGGTSLRSFARVFPKDQAQRVGKAECRNIAGVSLIDQIVTKLIFMDFVDSLKDNFPNTPSGLGVGFNAEASTTCGENTCVGLAERMSMLQTKYGLPMVATDVGGWEACFNILCTKMTVFVALHTADNVDDSNREIFLRFTSWWARSACSILYMTVDGHILSFFSQKVQRSGCYMTSPANTISRISAAIACLAYEAVANGDDSGEINPIVRDFGETELLKIYGAHGLIIREIEVMNPNTFLFCSHKFYRKDDGSWGCYLQTWQRMLVETIYKKPMPRLKLLGTLANYRSDLKDMEDTQLRDKIFRYLIDWALIICDDGTIDRVVVEETLSLKVTTEDRGPIATDDQEEWKREGPTQIGPNEEDYQRQGQLQNCLEQPHHQDGWTAQEDPQRCLR